MYWRTQRLIQQRDAEIERSVIQDHNGDTDRFRSATVNNTFVNPFKEYRPQTLFEFLLVRVLEFGESFYGNKIEIHEKYPTADGELAEVGDSLKTFRPNYELMRRNSLLLRLCIASGNFRPMSAAQSGNVPALDQMLLTWLGQSCCLVQVGGVNILTDPIFSDHLMSKHIGPKRLVKSPMSVQDIHTATGGHLDLVLVSHNHPDHLDLDAVLEIGNRATWIVPLGLKKTLARRGVYNVIEMDWWDSVPLNTYITRNAAELPDKFEVLCVPSMHWSGRHVVDINNTLWGSFIVKRNGESILYHVGDTGYCRDLFDTIGKRFGPIKLLLLPIGQYCPSWHQKPRHISPSESVEIARQTGTSRMFGIHFGTWKLSSEPILESKKRLLQLAEELCTDAYLVPEFGWTYEFNLGEIVAPMGFK